MLINPEMKKRNEIITDAETIFSGDVRTSKKYSNEICLVANQAIDTVTKLMIKTTGMYNKTWVYVVSIPGSPIHLSK
tara:strand:- start:1083 stop:1313 length:231 start_codon:yes stop_codon:yes gene_type:complete